MWIGEFEVSRLKAFSNSERDFLRDKWTTKNAKSDSCVWFCSIEQHQFTQFMSSTETIIKELNWWTIVKGTSFKFYSNRAVYSPALESGLWAIAAVQIVSACGDATNSKSSDKKLFTGHSECKRRVCGEQCGEECGERKEDVKTMTEKTRRETERDRDIDV